MRSLSSLLVFAVSTAALLAQTAPTWAAPTPAPTSPPSVRRAGAMAFDAVTNRLIAYGGLTLSPAAVTNQTWAFSAAPAATWTLLTPATQPPARWGHRMVRNTVNNKLITFGGRSPSISAFARDTWEYTGVAGGGNWAGVATANAPSARYLYGLAFDEARQRVVLFGGSSATATFADTWEYDGTDWTERATPQAPPARDDMVMVHDPVLNRTVMFGGFDPETNTMLGDTWLFDGTTWYEMQPEVSPSARFSASAVYDTYRKRVVMFGGYDGAPKQDTFEFTGSTWRSIAAGAPLPPNSTEAYSGYDVQRRRFHLFGGYGTTFTGATWEMAVPTGTAAGQTGVFGAFSLGCSLSGEPPTIAATVPTLGQQLAITLDGLSPTSLALVVIGLSNRTYSGLPLPIDLSTVGFAPCPLLVAPDVVGVAGALSSQLVYNVLIGTQPALLNAVLYFQGVTLEPSSTSATTPAARAVIGN